MANGWQTDGNRLYVPNHALLLCWNLFLNQDVFREIEAKRPVGSDMTVDERRQCIQVFLFHLLQVLRVGQHLLNEQRIYIDEANLQQME